MDLKRLEKLTAVLLIATLISGCSPFHKQSSINQDSLTNDPYAVIDRSTGAVAQYLLNITNCEAISLDAITEWVESCDDTDGYYDYIYSDPDSWDIFLYVPKAQEVFGDIENRSIEIEVSNSVLMIYIDTTTVNGKEKRSNELLIHFAAPSRGAWPVSSELYVDGNQIKHSNEDTAQRSLDEVDTAQAVNVQEKLSMVRYPEWIYLSENLWDSSKIYSPIDHDYNIRAMKQDFIGDTASEFIAVWSAELDFQYNKCMQVIPEEYRDVFERQQSSWQEYLENDAFNEIGAEHGYGYTRESFLICMDKIRARTLEIMRIEYLIRVDIAVEFNYESIDNK